MWERERGTDREGHRQRERGRKRERGTERDTDKERERKHEGDRQTERGGGEGGGQVLRVGTSVNRLRPWIRDEALSMSSVSISQHREHPEAASPHD